MTSEPPNTRRAGADGAPESEPPDSERPPGAATEAARPTVWVVKADKGRYADRFVAGGYAAAGRADVSAAKDDTEIRRLLHAAGTGIKSEWRQLGDFLFHMRVGDYVITPEADRVRLRYGRVTGPCVGATEDDGCPYRNRRAVVWDARSLHRSDFSESFRKRLRELPTVSEVRQSEEFLAAIGQSTPVVTPKPAPPVAKPPVVTTRTGRPSYIPADSWGSFRKAVEKGDPATIAKRLQTLSNHRRRYDQPDLTLEEALHYLPKPPVVKPVAKPATTTTTTATTATDSDRGVEEERVDPESGAVEHPFDPAKIKVRTVPALVGQLLSRMEHAEIDLAPDFQRMSGIWNAEKKSRLIESLLLRIPIPVFYVAADADEKWAVVDGVQRLSTIRDYVKGEFPLTRLEYRSEFDGLRHGDLPRPMQRRIDETQFVVNVIEPGTPPEVTFNIFSRINTGGMPLKGQEIRHALNPGPVRDYLKTLAESREFVKATAGSISPNRMDDRACVLRFLAFHMAPWEEYSGRSLDGHLDAAMKKINAMGQDRRNLLAEDFRKAMRAAARIFGDDAFRKRYVRDDDRRRQVSMPLFEAWSVQLARCSQERIDRLVERRDEVRERFMALLNQDPEFEKAISSSTGTPRRIRKRFAAIRDLVQEFF